MVVLFVPYYICYNGRVKKTGGAMPLFLTAAPPVFFTLSVCQRGSSNCSTKGILKVF